MSEELIETRQEPIELDGLGELNDTLIVTGDEVMRVTLNPVQNASNLEDILREAESRVRPTFERQVRQRVKSLADRLERKENELEQARRDLFLDAVRTVLPLLGQGWSYDEERDALRHDGRIDATRVKIDGGRYMLTDEYIGEWYTEGIIVPLTDNSDRLRNVNVETHRHVNVNTGGSLCLGSLRADNLKEGLEQLPDLLRTLHCDSANRSSLIPEIEAAVNEMVDEDTAEEVEVWEA